ncbi:MAG: BrnT family toxin [Spirochaetia bacterium]|jgi:uncharacterized DUF497 family protein|nr:BrnT family toxin [Spirochaetia bacterium]
MDFEWNIQKAENNIKKHDISFEEASTVFGDVLSTTFLDPEHSIHEGRYLVVGFSDKYKVLVVSHTFRNENIRIISARQATFKEKRFYEHGK